MSKVYTKTGDEGKTSLIGGERVKKYDSRVEAYGTVDELTAFTALLCDELRNTASLASVVDELERIESMLMTAASVLAVGEGGVGRVRPLEESDVAYLEGRIDDMQNRVSAVDKFTIPGGCREVSLCHICRTICRRAERAALRAEAEHGEIDRATMKWLNRLSDYFYLLGRLLTEILGVEERLWRP